MFLVYILAYKNIIYNIINLKYFNYLIIIKIINIYKNLKLIYKFIIIYEYLRYSV